MDSANVAAAALGICFNRGMPSASLASVTSLWILCESVPTPRRSRAIATIASRGVVGIW